jgi:hypothetical protein
MDKVASCPGLLNYPNTGADTDGHTDGQTRTDTDGHADGQTRTDTDGHADGHERSGNASGYEGKIK